MEIYTSIGLLILSIVLTFLTTWFWKKTTATEDERQRIRDRLDKMDLAMTILTTQVSPFWAAVQTKIAKDLTHPSFQFKEMDKLLHELESLTITDEGRARLEVLLDERIISTDPEVSEAEKDSARLMKGVMAKVIIEAEKIINEEKLPGLPGLLPVPGPSDKKSDKKDQKELNPVQILTVPIVSDVKIKD